MSGRGGRGAGRGTPRGATSSSRGAGGHSRGTSGLRGGLRGSGPPIPAGQPHIASHVTTVGVKRPNFGKTGRLIKVYVNAFETSIPDGIIVHYDVAISPSEKTLPLRLNMEIIKELQTAVEPVLFTPKAVYDGRKNLFAIRDLPGFIQDAEKPYREFSVPLGDPSPSPNGRGPKIFKVRLTRVAEINPETLSRFIAGEQSHDNSVLTAITALNVVIRMEPSLNFPFNVRSFFTDQEKKSLGMGLETWRGYFQSVRPAIGRMLINIDISTAVMYQAGPLINLCLAFLGKEGQNPNVLAPKSGLPDRSRLALQRHISGIRVNVRSPDGRIIPRIVKKLSSSGAAQLSFKLRDGSTKTVAQYFQEIHNRALQFPDVLCVEVGSGALIPMELCIVGSGQIVRKQVPPQLTKNVLQFATQKPQARLDSITRGLSVLQYGQSDYVRQFGMNVKTAAGPLNINARVLTPPTLRYGDNSQEPTITPRDGAWNMLNKRFFRPALVSGPWCIAIFERAARFNSNHTSPLIDGLCRAARDVGLALRPTTTVMEFNPQGDVHESLMELGRKCQNENGRYPLLIVAVIAEGANDTYTAIKHFGDVAVGVATQCLKSSKCYRANPQYFANVMLKINVKLGGINLIPDPKSVEALTNPRTPTILMGADVIHPAPGADGRPSFTSLVGNIDSDASKYVATCCVQTSRQEMIDDLKDMAMTVIRKYMAFRKEVEKKLPNALPPKRIIFYRDGVSEGQFAQVLEQELPRLQAACREIGLNPMPKITVIVVGKRHHVRFFPVKVQDADKSGNCPAGTVVDSDIGHPTEFDFYLQSHGGLLGTSRPAHYSVLYDDNNFTADTLQSLSFALCHVYARSTRSVSIPAPVYYADIVASRAKNHYDPRGSVNLSDSQTEEQQSSREAANNLDAFRRDFKPLHPSQQNRMYFS